MKARAGTLRFLDEQTLLDALWPALERFVNRDAPSQAFSTDDEPDSDVGRQATDEEEIGPSEWADVRRLLATVVRGGNLQSELDATVAPAPLALGRKGWMVLRAQSQRDRLQRYYFTIRLLTLPTLSPLLRQCDQCGRFFRGTRAHRRSRSFCSPRCRYAFHRGRRGRQAHAKQMKENREVHARRRRRKLAREGR